MPDARVSGHRKAIESKFLCFRPYVTKELCDAAKAEVVLQYVEVKQTPQYGERGKTAGLRKGTASLSAP